MSKPLIYLSGPMAGLAASVADRWRLEFRNLVPEFRCLSPMRGLPLGYSQIIPRSSEIHPFTTARGVVARDRWDVRRCDVMVVNVLGAETVSIGTVAEMAWADAYGKPVVLVMEASNPHEHPMVTELAGFRVETLMDAAVVVRGLVS